MVRSLPLGPEVASRMEALVGAVIRPSSSSASDQASTLPAFSFATLSLANRFAIAAAIILLNGMALMGSWVASRIEHSVVQNAGVQLALPMEGVVRSVAGDLAAHGVGSLASQQLIDDLLTKSAAGGQIVAVKIWRPDCTLSFATDRSLNGRTFPMFKELAAALEGTVMAVYNNTRRDHLNELAARLKMPLFEIYVPLRAPETGSVVGVAEFYQNAAHLEVGISRAKWNTWLVVGGATFAMFSLLYAIVRGGSKVIEEQRQALEARVEEEKALNLQNTVLRQQLQRANRRGTELNERFLRRVSSDLHDGPAQHLALALLRLDELVPLVNALPNGDGAADTGVLGTIRRATGDALREIRNISSGLALPELQKISPADALSIAVRAHERATGTPVAMDLGGLPARLPLPITICMFRFAQEGLNNAFHHASGKGQRVRARSDGAMIEVDVLDSGPGFVVEQKLNQSERIGLAGLRHRVESLGGTLLIQSALGAGTRLGLRFPASASGAQDHG